ncbi:hypothetical protein BJ684DRAFT_14828 [Piptocephalis cylindrospora]|uniref:Uncharacterized protein n=1 Tax=Piptocephalis cylindrospora TaxID=1907219 RepID=A0A4P9Y7Z1_9FUNG|nr:hypothetical protein BJ684DRAFT_14828 [Piptocephalis cylindrospora]|eukprot:RKP14884.1 hypothetical protein BJ684DRAFT_14828 [Piptocephalis cylindrospora]
MPKRTINRRLIGERSSSHGDGIIIKSCLVPNPQERAKYQGKSQRSHIVSRHRMLYRRMAVPENARSFTWIPEYDGEGAKRKGREMLVLLFPSRFSLSPAALKEQDVRGLAWINALRDVKIPRPLYRTLPYLYSLMRAHHSCPYWHILNKVLDQDAAKTPLKWAIPHRQIHTYLRIILKRVVPSSLLGRGDNQRVLMRNEEKRDHFQQFFNAGHQGIVH